MFQPFLLLYWLVTMATGFFALGLVRRTLPSARVSERLALGALAVMGWTVLQTLLLGAFAPLYARASLILTDMIMLGCATRWLRADALAAWREAGERMLALLRRTRPAWAWSAALPLVAALGFWGSALQFSFVVPYPGHDAVTYHLPIATMIVQEGQLGHYRTRAGHVNEFPRNGQMLFAKQLAYGEDERPMRLVQWFFGLVAVVALYAWMRKWRVRGGMALALAPMYLLVPAVLNQPYVLWGTIDLIFHVIIVAMLMVVAAPCRDRAEAWRRVLWAAFLGGLAMGTKGQGVLWGPAGVWIALFRWFFADSDRPAIKACVRAVVTAAALAAVFGVQTYFLSWKEDGNPIKPIQVTLFGKVIFPGHYNSVAELVETGPYTGSDNNAMATLLSWSAVWCRDWVYNDRRVGAWGPTWIFALFPLSLLGLLVRYRRSGDRAFTVVLATLYLYFLFKSEGSWWSRFSLSHFGIALALTAAALADIGRPALRGLLAAAIVGLSVVTAAEAVATYRRHNDRRPYFPPEGQYLHSLQVYRPFTYGESEHDRELYEWVGTNMEPGETFVYYHPAWSGLYHYWFYRRDFRNRVYGYDSSKDLESMARLLHRRDTTYFMVQDLPDNRVFDWAPLIGDLVFKTGRFHVYRFDPERARPIHGEEDD